MEEIKNCRTLISKPEGKGPLKRARHKLDDNIRVYLREIRWEGVDWMHLAQDTDQ
jgi:hypothetical protein